MARSFAELQNDERVTSAEVCKVLEEYSVQWAITAYVVIELIERTHPSDNDIEKMMVSAQKGESIQIGFGFGCYADAFEYKKVFNYLKDLQTKRRARNFLNLQNSLDRK